MKRFKIYDSYTPASQAGFRIFILLVFAIFLNHESIFINHVHAADSTASAEKTSTPSSTLSQKLEELKKEIASKAAQLKQEVNKKMENKAFVGTVSLIEGNNLKILTKNEEKSVRVDEYTTYNSKVKSKKSKLSLNSLKAGDSIAALGDVDDKGVLNAKRVVIVDKVASSEAKLIAGVVQSKESYTVHILSGDKVIDLLTTSKTSYLASGEEASIATAKKDQFVIAKGIEEDGIFRTRLLYFVQAVPMKVERKTSTGSGSAEKAGN